MRDAGINPSCRLISLFGRTCATIDGSVDAPNGRISVYALQTHEILEFCPVSVNFIIGRQPKSTIHGFEYCFSLHAIGCRILPYQFGNAGNQKITAIVIGRSMRHCSTVVIKRIAGPNAAVSIIKMVSIGIPVTLLPFKVEFQRGPKLPHECCIGIVLEMPEKFIDIVEIHIVMAHLSVIIRQLADVSIAIHRCAPLFGRAGKVLGRILGRMRVDGLDVAHHASGVSTEMTKLPIEPSCHIAHITTSPAGKWCAPSDTTMHPRLPIPQAIGSSHQGGAKGIDQRIGSLKTQLPNQLLMEQVLLLHELFTVLGINQYKVIIIDKAQISGPFSIPLQLLAQ